MARGFAAIIYKFWRNRPIFLIFFLLSLVMSAGAVVYVFYYESLNLTVRPSDVVLLPASDMSATCSAFPCASGGTPTAGDVIAVGVSMFPASTSSPAPATYYTNLSLISNIGANTHTLSGVQVSITSGAPNLGNMTVYDFSSPTLFLSDGGPSSTAHLLGSCSVSYSSKNCSFTPSITSLAPGSSQYVEIAVYASATASVGGTTSLQIAVEWA